MACSSYTLKGIVNDCAGNIGGVSEVWLANYDAVKVASGTTEIEGREANVITGITVDTGYSFVKFYVRKNTSSMVSTLNVNDNGSTYVSTVLSMVFARMDAVKRMEMNALAKEDLVALVKDANGTWHYMGYDNPVTSSNGTGETGTARSDNNQYTSELTDESNEYPYQVQESALRAIGVID